ncbi:hypothetical protein PilKf_00677 [Pillotina sp. SPG140]
MYGAIIGDICGSSYEFNPCKTDQINTIKLSASDSQFTDDTVLTCASDSRLTDDTVLTCAVIDVILHKTPYTRAL